MDDKTYDLDKLGVVLAVHTEITKDSLMMLKEQQKRQVRMIWSSMAIVAMAIAIVGLAVYCTFSSLDKITEQVNINREMILQNTEAINHEHSKEASKGLSE